MTKLELLDKLRQLDEYTVLDLLGLTTDNLVDNFLDTIDDRIEYLYKTLEE